MQPHCRIVFNGSGHMCQLSAPQLIIRKGLESVEHLLMDLLISIRRIFVMVGVLRQNVTDFKKVKMFAGANGPSPRVESTPGDGWSPPGGQMSTTGCACQMLPDNCAE